jgi:hypothetical protein
MFADRQACTHQAVQVLLERVRRQRKSMHVSDSARWNDIIDVEIFNEMMVAVARALAECKTRCTCSPNEPCFYQLHGKCNASTLDLLYATMVAPRPTGCSLAPNANTVCAWLLAAAIIDSKRAARLAHAFRERARVVFGEYAAACNWRWETIDQHKMYTDDERRQIHEQIAQLGVRSFDNVETPSIASLVHQSHPLYFDLNKPMREEPNAFLYENVFEMVCNARAHPISHNEHRITCLTACGGKFKWN